MTEMWTTTYAPKTLEEVLGNPQAVGEVLQWAKNWSNGSPQPPLVLHGPTGCGKTALCEVLVTTFGFQKLEWNASDLRDKETLEKVIGSASRGQTFTGQRRLIIIEEVDAMTNKEDRGGMSTIMAIAKESQNPLLLTANDLYADKKLAPLRTLGVKVEFKKPLATSVLKLLQKVSDAEGLDYDLVSLQEIAKASQGDFRAALLDLQGLALHSKKITLEDVESLGFRERGMNVFDAMQKIFHAKKINEVQQIRQSADVDPDLMMRWMEENIPRHFTKNNDDFRRAMHYLSRADIFGGRIMGRQHWGFLKYQQELATAGVAIQREKSYPGFIRYQFPMLLSQLSRSASIRQQKKSTAEKTQGKFHGSWRKIAQDILLLRPVFEKDIETAAHYAASFDWDETDLAFATGKKEDSKHVQKIMARAKELHDQQVSRHVHEGRIKTIDSAEEPVEEKAKPKTDDVQQTRLF